ncbi:ABC transporter substrate-binding protein [Nocardioides maradonensis]
MVSSIRRVPKGRGRSPYRRSALILTGTLVASLLSGCGGSGGVPVINLYGGAAETGFDKIIAECNQQAHGAYKIVGNLLPSDADGQREQLVRRLAAHSDSMDLLGLDVTWTAEFAQAGWIRELTGDQRAAASKDVVKPALATATWQGKLYAIPKHTNVQLLWYRKSLTPTPPTTWDQVVADAQKLKSEGKPHVISVTGREYEGYVVLFNTILSSLGGTIVNADSTQVTIDDKTTQALKIIHDLATDGLGSPSMSVSQEQEVFQQIQTGEAAFALNWPYTYGSMKTADPAVYKDLAWTTLPSFAPGQPGRATLGGMNLAISAYSKHPQQAYDAAMCLRSPEHEVEFAAAGNEPPVLASLYQDKQLQAAYPEYKEILAELRTAVPRPATPLYQNISTVISSTLSPPASIDPPATTEALTSAIQQAIDGKGILP